MYPPSIAAPGTNRPAPEDELAGDLREWATCASSAASATPSTRRENTGGGGGGDGSGVGGAAAAAVAGGGSGGRGEGALGRRAGAGGHWGARMRATHTCPRIILCEKAYRACDNMRAHYCVHGARMCAHARTHNRAQARTHTYA